VGFEDADRKADAALIWRALVTTMIAHEKMIDDVFDEDERNTRRSILMPFVRIDLIRGKSPEYRKTLGDVVYQAMRDVINVPESDKFQLITEHAPDELNVAESYLGQHYSRDIILIQITLNAGRTVEQKKAFTDASSTT
jgi:hypothetical protein